MTMIVCKLKDCIHNKKEWKHSTMCYQRRCRCTTIGVEVMINFITNSTSKTYAMCDSYLEKPEILKKHLNQETEGPE